MQVLCLADLKTPAMDKLYYYVLQTDRMRPKYLQDAEEVANNFLTSDTVLTMARPSTAGLMGLRANDDAGEDDDNDDNILDSKNIFNGTEEEVDSDDNG